MSKLYTYLGRILISSFLLFGSVIVSAKPRQNQKLNAFIPPEYELMDSASGDLNDDGKTDYVLILRKKDETSNPSSPRPLLLIMGTGKGNLELFARNDSVVLCANCGGIYGDPYQKITIKDQLLSVEHYIGSNWRWTRVICFKYDIDEKALVLYKDEGVSYHVSNPNKQTNIITNKEDFGKLLFTRFSYNKGY